MKLLLVVANFVPEIGSAAHIYFDLSKAFVNHGHEVHVITSYPREFNLGENDKNKNFPLDEIIDGIHVHRCRHPAQRDNVVLRGLEHFVLPRYYFKIYKNLGIKFDACLMYIPPLPLYYLARKIKKYDGIPSVLNFQDFHPQELTDVGVLKNPLMIKILEHIERKAYKNADFITVLSKQGIDYVTERGGSKERIAHVYNGANVEDFNTIKKGSINSKLLGQNGKTIVTYAGILSPYQGIDHILDVAIYLKDHEDIEFYIVGNGSVKQHLQERISNEDISNVRLFPFQPRDEYFNIINSSDISFISLDERMKAPCLPGKIKDLLGMGQPIIASVPKNSETADVVSEADCGIVVEPGNTEDLSKSILSIKNNDELKADMGRKGQKFFEENMDLEKNVAEYEKIFNIII